MANRRIKLQEILENFTGTDRVYFQPPDSLKLKYPCIIYERNNTYGLFANNDLYIDKDGYQLTVVDRDPDSILYNKMKGFRYSTFVRHYVSDNLHHWVFNLYF